jgi:hypothetical protein
MSVLQFLIDFFTDPAKIGLSIIVGLICVWLLSLLFPARIKFGYDVLLEDHKRALLRKDKAEIISDLLVLMGKSPFTEEDRLKANKHLLDLCLYLPPCLVHRLAEVTAQSKKGQEIGPLGLFIDIRAYLDGEYRPDKKAKLDKGQIPQYPAAIAQSHTIPVQLSPGKRVQITVDCKVVDQ